MAAPSTADEFDGTDGSPLVRSGWDGDTAVFGLSNDRLRVFSDNPGVIVHTPAEGSTQQASLEFGGGTGLLAGERVGLVLKKQATTGACDAVYVMWEPASSTVRVQVCEGAGPTVDVDGTASVPANTAYVSARASSNGVVEVYAGSTSLTATCVLRVTTAWTHAGSGGYVGIAAVGANGVLINKFGAQ